MDSSGADADPGHSIHTKSMYGRIQMMYALDWIFKARAYFIYSVKCQCQCHSAQNSILIKNDTHHINFRPALILVRDHTWVTRTIIVLCFTYFINKVVFKV